MSVEGAEPESGRRDFRLTYYERQVANIARDLRDLADKVEREGRPYSSASITGLPRYLYAAERVNHSIETAMANIAPSRLFQAAYDADQAEVAAAAEALEQQE